MSTDVLIRPAVLTKDDDGFMLRAFDSALPHLAAIGSGDQWGSVPFTSKPSQVEQTKAAVCTSQRIQALLTDACSSTHPSTAYSTGDQASHLRSVLDKVPQEQWDEVFVAERLDPTSDALVRLGAMMCSLYAPSYIVQTRPDVFASATTLRLGQHTQDAAPPTFVYVGRLIVHRDPLGVQARHGEATTSADLERSAALGKGVGGKMMRFAIEQAQLRGIPIMYVDCWNGNGGALVRYYESLGFRRVGTFDVPDKHGPGLPWSGELLRLDLP
ncbi:hypothetical protein OC861_004342 [Tilletia horrida]|nr:hypothetical protein OC845_004120 [Tilletia horrida]KAK0564344.1 hypothetical protein OC861_004342 [Tilletia horrida]